MVFDNRLYNEMNQDVGVNETDNAPDLNAQVDMIDLDTKVIETVEKSGEIQTVMDIRNAFSNIREEAAKSSSSANLTMLYGQAGNLIKLLDTQPFVERVGDEIDEFRQVAEEEFARTAHELNSRAKEVGARSHYAEKWGD
jgi:hypothetical protein